VIAWVDSDVESSDEIATGVWKLPDGPRVYEERLSAETTTDMTAEQIHALGLARSSGSRVRWTRSPQVGSTAR